MKKEINKACNYFQRQFGNVMVKETGVYPGKEPTRSRSLSYNFVQINYFPQKPTDKNFKIDDKLNSSGFVWLPNCIIGWLKIDDSNFFVYQALTSLDSHNWFGIFSKDRIASYLKSCTIDNFKYLRFSFFLPMNIPLFGLLTLHENNSLAHYANTIFYCSAFGVLLRFIFTILANAIFYSLLFAAIYSISKRASLYNLNFKSFLTTAIYASFPGIIIGTIFTITQIPWFQYQTIYLIAFVIYLIAVTQRLRKLDNKDDLPP